MRKKNPFKIILLAICGVIIITPVTIILIYAIYFVHNLEMKNENYYYESKMFGKWYCNEKLSNEGATYYENIQSSLKHLYVENEQEKYTPKEADKVVVFGNEMLLYICMSKNVAVGNTLRCFMIEKKEGLYSYPLYDWEQTVNWYKGKAQKKCRDYDRVALDIASSYLYRKVTAQANNGSPIFYGVGKEAETKNLSIMGLYPDEVFPFTYENETYYFWYYMDGSTFVKRMEECTVLEQMTVAEAIEYFEIKLE